MICNSSMNISYWLFIINRTNCFHNFCRSDLISAYVVQIYSKIAATFAVLL